MTEHLRKQFDLDLDSIRTRVLQMGSLVEQQVLMAIDCFCSGDEETTRLVIEADKRVDEYEIGIDESCTLVIARRQPAASDLRLIMAVSRIVSDLERIGDKASKIARMSRQLHASGALHVPPLTDIHQCALLATDMLRRAIDSLEHLDADLARQVIGEDKEVDAAFNAILRQLITFMMEDPRTIGESLDIIWIAKAVERVGDHAANIAENVIYIVSGVDVRHSAAKKAVVA